MRKRPRNQRYLRPGEEKGGISYLAPYSVTQREYKTFTINVETGGNWDFDEGLEEFELRDYQISRERIGLARTISEPSPVSAVT